MASCVPSVSSGTWSDRALKGEVDAAYIAARLVEEASRCHMHVSTAESCTAGMVASCIAGVPGASDVLLGGAVTYTDEIKHRVLGVSTDTLARFSAVSRECARELACGSRRLYSSSLAVSVTGYAGPGGGTAEDPVGTVYFGLASEQGISTWRASFAGSRRCVREAAAAFALALLLDGVEGLRN